VAHRVVSITPGLVRGAGRAVARGFHDNEIWVWMLPGDRRRRTMLPRHYRAMIRHVFLPRGGAWTTPETLGAALWFPPGTHSFSTREHLIELLSLLPEGVTALPKGARFDELRFAHFPKEPHWYLNTLAVVPEQQGRGIGSALIEPGLARADADGLGAYLETQRESNIPFYRRFGFELTERIALPDGPPLWLMWRPPESSGRATR
jgi:GNAT superfamily N-acetyltransferase